MNEVTFGVIADLHCEIMHDAKERLDAFLRDCESHRVDFILHLGDMTFRPTPEGGMNACDRMYRAFPRPSYHIIGNHETDKFDKETLCRHMGIPRGYYSFNEKGFHFVALDPNHLLIDGQIIPYAHGNYFKHPEGLNHLGDEQFQWLEEDLEKNDLPVIILSHQCLEGSNGSAALFEPEAVRLRALFRRMRQNGKRVFICLNGHTHIDRLSQIDDVFYLEVNSASNKWLGEKYQALHYDKSVHDAHPSLKNTMPYAEPLYAVISIDDGGLIRVKGRKSEFVPPCPAELKHSGLAGKTPITPQIRDRTLRVVN